MKLRVVVATGQPDGKSGWMHFLSKLQECSTQVLLRDVTLDTDEQLGICSLLSF